MKKRKLLILIIAVIIGFTSCQCNVFAQPVPDQYVYVTEDCNYTLEDFRVMFDFLDNCAIKDTIQLPAPGTTVSIITSPVVVVEIIARDFSDNIARVTFNVILVDTVPPTIIPKAGLLGEFNVFDRVGGSKLRATPVTMRGSGWLRELAGNHKGYDNGNMILALYSDDIGKPDRLMATTGEVQLNNNAGWQVEPVLEPIRLNEGQRLWIAFITDREVTNEGFMASPIENMSDVSAHVGEYTGIMPMEFGESSQWEWGHSVHLRFTVDGNDIPLPVLAEQFLQVEQFINKEIQDFKEEFDWSTYGIDTVLHKPRWIPLDPYYLSTD